MIALHQHNLKLRQVDRDFNSYYNSLFVNKYSFLCARESAVDLHGVDGVKKGFIAYETAWLSNIDRLMSMIFANSTEFDALSYDLIDLGGGKSISTIYLSHMYEFRSVTSIDISPQMLEDGKRNLDAYRKIEGKRMFINFLCQDIQEFLLEKGRYIFFAFNPFEWSVFERFIEHNLKVLRGSDSILLYANDRCINQLLNYSKLLARDDYYNLSVVKF